MGSARTPPEAGFGWWVGRGLFGLPLLAGWLCIRAEVMPTERDKDERPGFLRVHRGVRSPRWTREKPCRGPFIQGITVWMPPRQVWQAAFVRPQVYGCRPGSAVGRRRWPEQLEARKLLRTPTTGDGVGSLIRKLRGEVGHVFCNRAPTRTTEVGGA